MPRKTKKESPVFLDTYNDPIHEKDERELFENFDVNSHEFNDKYFEHMGKSNSKHEVPVVSDLIPDKILDMETDLMKYSRNDSHKKKKRKINSDGGTKKKRKTVSRSVKKRKNTKKK